MRRPKGIKKAIRQYTQQEAPDWQNQKLILAKAIVKELKKLNKDIIKELRLINRKLQKIIEMSE